MSNGQAIAANLESVLGPVYWSAIFPTADAATLHACSRIASGRMAMTWSVDGRHYCAWGPRL
jgi:hypothetical protein